MYQSLFWYSDKAEVEGSKSWLLLVALKVWKALGRLRQKAVWGVAMMYVDGSIWTRKNSTKHIWKDPWRWSENVSFFFWTSIILKEFPWYEIQLFFRFMLMLPWSMELGMCEWLWKRPLKTPKASMLNSGGQVVSLPSGWDPLKYRMSMRIRWENIQIWPF